MRGGDVNKFETLGYQREFTTEKFKHRHSEVKITFLSTILLKKNAKEIR